MSAFPRLLCLVSLLAVSTSAHAARFSRADFKYSSDSHLAPAARFAHLDKSAEAASEQVRSFIARQEGRGTVATTGEAASFKLAPQAQEKWDAQRAICEAEWQAFSDNDFKAYKAIDRTNPLAAEAVVEFGATPKSASFYFRTETAARVGHRDLNFTYFKVRIDERITSALYVWGWINDTGKLDVYARAVPRLVDVEAAPGASVDFELWDAITGVYERDMVKELLEELAR